MKGGTLKQASRLYSKGNFSEIIRLLEPQVFRYRESFSFYYYLGFSCLHTGDIAGAFSYLSRASDLKKDNIDTLNALAAIHLKRGEMQDALRLWLRVLDLDPRDKRAVRGLELLKKNQDPDSLYSLTESGAFKQFFPGPGRFQRILPLVIALCILVPLLFAGGFFLLKSLQVRQTSGRPGIESLLLEDDESLTEYSGSYRYILTEKEITESFSRMGKYFVNHRDNLVRKEINYILGSNTAEKLKEKARNLSSYLSVPTFTSLLDSFSYSQVISDPYLYNGTYIVWKGRASNIVISDSDIRFDFLVGYHENKVLEGTVPVEIDFAAHIIQNMPLEILGQIRSDGRSILLAGISIHQLEP